MKSVDGQVYERLRELTLKRGITLRLVSFDERLAKKLPSKPTKEEMCEVRKAVAGVHFQIDGWHYIYLNKHFRGVNRASTLAHELKHYLQDEHKRIDKAKYRKGGSHHIIIELEANLFADRLVSFLRHRFNRPEKVIPPVVKLEEYRRRKSRVVNLADYRRPRPAAQRCEMKSEFAKKH
ncbi:MAG: ImmA/IrrE family metallo-endopeptidase [Candidatus Marsarchaeota archaeon]|nr:ImmA/IrrE family metallo-endopeptidase [Candidatus Marsarchaeota archaeon]